MACSGLSKSGKFSPKQQQRSSFGGGKQRGGGWPNQPEARNDEVYAAVGCMRGEMVLRYELTLRVSRLEGGGARRRDQRIGHVLHLPAGTGPLLHGGRYALGKRGRCGVNIFPHQRASERYQLSLV